MDFTDFEVFEDSGVTVDNSGSNVRIRYPEGDSRFFEELSRHDTAAADGSKVETG